MTLVLRTPLLLFHTIATPPFQFYPASLTVVTNLCQNLVVLFPPPAPPQSLCRLPSWPRTHPKAYLQKCRRKDCSPSSWIPVSRHCRGTPVTDPIYAAAHAAHTISSQIQLQSLYGGYFGEQRLWAVNKEFTFNSLARRLSTACISKCCLWKARLTTAPLSLKLPISAAVTHSEALWKVKIPVMMPASVAIGQASKIYFSSRIWISKYSASEVLMYFSEKIYFGERYCRRT